MEIKYNNVTTKEEAYEKVKGAITPELLAKFQVNAEVKCDDSKPSIVAAGKGFELICGFKEESLTIELNLSFLLKPFKNKVLDSIKRQVERVV